MKIICIGAGASGLFFSLNAAAYGNEVALLESNSKAGKKLAITGKGRCNITNNCSPDDVIKNVVRNPKFLYSSINNFAPSDTINWFNNHNCPLKTERGNRVFPLSDKSSDIINTLLRECKKNNVEILYNQKVTDIKKENDKFIIKTKDDEFIADKVVIATGGKSYPLTGSNGDGYKFAKKFNHTIINPLSALCPIRIKETINHDMVNLTLKNVSLTAKSASFNKNIFGDLEFLDKPNAITGPIALTLSSLINRLGDVELELDFKPALDEEKLNNRLLREISSKPNENVNYLLKTLLPYEILDFFVKNSNINTSKILNSFTKNDRNELIKNLKHFHLTYLGLDDISKGIITSGGISVNEVNQKSMESKLVKGLYFIGEVLDVDAFTGGFNLQIALATAYSCAMHINE